MGGNMKKILLAVLMAALTIPLFSFEYVGKSENNIDFFECSDNKDVAAFFNKNPDTFSLVNNLSGVEKRTDNTTGKNDFYIIGVTESGRWVIIHRTKDYDYIYLPLEE
jgi:hypothetical protein